AVVHVARQRRDPNVLRDFLGAPAFKFPSIVGSHRRHLLPERLDILCKLRHQRGAKLIPVECRSGVQYCRSSLGNLTEFHFSPPSGSKPAMVCWNLLFPAPTNCGIKRHSPGPYGSLRENTIQPWRIRVNQNLPPPSLICGRSAEGSGRSEGSRCVRWSLPRSLVSPKPSSQNMNEAATCPPWNCC